MRFQFNSDRHGNRHGHRHGRRGWNFEFGPEGPFGPSGPFGPDGPFGPEGPFGPGGPFGGGGGGPRGRGGKRGKRMFGQGELRVIVLRLLGESPRHGYEIIKAIGEMTEGRYEPSPGTIYPLLSMLLDEGLIEEAESEDARKPYRLTQAGEEALAELGETVEHLEQRLTRQAEERQRNQAPDVMRAVGNLVQVISNKFRHTRIDVNSREELVDLIDELARRIEKL